MVGALSDVLVMRHNKTGIIYIILFNYISLIYIFVQIILRVTSPGTRSAQKQNQKQTVCVCVCMCV